MKHLILLILFIVFSNTMFASYEGSIRILSSSIKEFETIDPGVKMVIAVETTVKDTSKEYVLEAMHSMDEGYRYYVNVFRSMRTKRLKDTLVLKFMVKKNVLNNYKYKDRVSLLLKLSAIPINKRENKVDQIKLTFTRGYKREDPPFDPGWRNPKTDTTIIIKGNKYVFEANKRLTFMPFPIDLPQLGKLKNQPIVSVGKYRFKLDSNYVYFYSTGDMKYCSPAEALKVEINGQMLELKPFERIYFTENNEFYIGVINNSLTIPIGKQMYDFPSGTNIWMYHDAPQLLYYVSLVNSQVFQVANKKFFLDKGCSIYFEKDGTVNAISFTTDKEFMVGGKPLKFRKREKIYFNSEGIITSGSLRGTQTLNVGGKNIPVKQTSDPVDFFADGSVKKVRGGLPYGFYVTVQGKQLMISKYSVTEFFKDGSLKSGIFNDNVELSNGSNKMVFTNKQWVEFTENGLVESGYLAYDTYLTNGKYRILFKANKEVVFREDGSLRSGTAGEYKTFYVNGLEQRIKPGTFVSFKKNGDLQVW